MWAQAAPSGRLPARNRKRAVQRPVANAAPKRSRISAVEFRRGLSTRSRAAWPWRRIGERQETRQIEDPIGGWTGLSVHAALDRTTAPLGVEGGKNKLGQGSKNVPVHHVRDQPARPITCRAPAIRTSRRPAHRQGLGAGRGRSCFPARPYVQIRASAAPFSRHELLQPAALHVSTHGATWKPGWPLRSAARGGRSARLPGSRNGAWRRGPLAGKGPHVLPDTDGPGSGYGKSKAARHWPALMRRRPLSRSSIAYERPFAARQPRAGYAAYLRGARATIPTIPVERLRESPPTVPDGEESSPAGICAKRAPARAARSPRSIPENRLHDAAEAMRFVEDMGEEGRGSCISAYVKPALALYGAGARTNALYGAKDWPAAQFATRARARRSATPVARPPTAQHEEGRSLFQRSDAASKRYGRPTWGLIKADR